MHTQTIPVDSLKKLSGDHADHCGRDHACSFCPREAQCQLDKPAHDKALIDARLAAISQIIIVLGNKGGVGKSTVAAHLATRLAAQGARVGLADADIHGPNAPRLFGLHEARCKVTLRGLGLPVYRDERNGSEVRVGSLGNLLPDADTPVVWRDAYKHDYVHQLFGSFDWGPLDFLIVDMPPGTGNELITLIDLLEGRSVAAVLVSSAAAVALQDSLKAARFCRERGLPILGLVENFAGFVCPHCDNHIELYPRDPAIDKFEAIGIETLARLPYASAIAGSAAAGDPGVVASHDELRERFDALVHVCVAHRDRSLARSVTTEIGNAMSAIAADPGLDKKLRALGRSEADRLDTDRRAG